MSQFNNTKEEPKTVTRPNGDFRNQRGGYNRNTRNYSTQQYNNRNPRRFNDNRGGNGQRNFQRRGGYHNNRRGNNRRFNNSNWRGGYNNRSSNNRKHVVQNKDGWSTVQGSNNGRFSNLKTNNTPMKPKKDDNQFNLLEQITVKKEVKDIPKVIKKKPVLQGAWGKGISNAVKEDVKFEKQIIKEEKDDGMVTLSNDLTQIQGDVKKTPGYLFKPVGTFIKWGDQAMDEDEEDYSDSDLDEWKNGYKDESSDESENDEYY